MEQHPNPTPSPLYRNHTSVVLYIIGSHIGWNNALTLPHSPLYRNHTSVVLYIVGSHIGWNNALTLPHSPLYRNHTYICCVVYSWQPYWMEQHPNPTPLPPL